MHCGAPVDDATAPVTRAPLRIPREGIAASTEAVWGHLTAAMGRLSPTLARILEDRPAVANRPALGALLAPGAALAGLILGAADPSVYGASLATIAILAGIAGLGAAVGLWAWLGFVAGDLLLRDPRTANVWGAARPPHGFWHLDAGVLVADLALAGLLVAAPLAAAISRRATGRFLGSRPSLARRPRLVAALPVLVGALVQLAYAAGWLRIASVLTRPIWTYSRHAPPAAGTRALRGGDLAVVLAATLAGIALTTLASQRERLTGSGARRQRGARHGSLPPLLSVPLGAAVVTLLLSGLLTSVDEGLALGIIVAAALALRTVIFPQSAALVSALGRVPLPVRVIAASLLGALGAVLLRILMGAPRLGSLPPSVLGVVLSLLLAGLLLAPERRRARRGGGDRPRPLPAAAVILLALLLTTAVTSAPAASGVPWWKQGHRYRFGQTQGTFTWSGDAQGRVSGRTGCSLETGMAAREGYAEYSVIGAGALNNSQIVKNDVQIAVYNFHGPGQYTFEALGDLPASGADIHVFPYANGFDFTSGHQPARAGPSASGSVTVRADGSGTIAGTLVDTLVTNKTIRIDGSWGPCTGLGGRSPSSKPSTARHVYWANPAAGTIGRADLASNPPTLDQSFITSATSPLWVAVDGAHIYWSIGNRGTGTIGRANLDGTGADQRFITAASDPEGVAVDGSHVYWANYSSGKGTTLGRANLDGSGADQSFITGASGPRGVAVDGSHIYWANSNTGTIGRANLSGTGADQSFIAGANYPAGVAVDGSHIYWVNTGTNTIGRANLDGSGADQSFITTPNVPAGVAVDGSHIYWADDATNTIGRANLNGTGADPTFITGANQPEGVAVDAAPPAQPGGTPPPSGPPIPIFQTIAANPAPPPPSDDLQWWQYPLLGLMAIGTDGLGLLGRDPELIGTVDTTDTGAAASTADAVAALDPELTSIWDESVPTPAGRAFYEADDGEMRDLASQVPEAPGQYTVDIHGTADYFTWGNTRLSAGQLADLIRADPAWAGQPIRLISCDTGAGAYPAAQQLADALGVPVRAPTELAWTNGNGDVWTDAGQTIVDPRTGQRVTIPSLFGDWGDWKDFAPAQPQP